MAAVAKRDFILFVAALVMGACGGQETDRHTEIKRSTLSVAATPSGHVFEDSVEVKLSSSGSAEIFYTLDGTSPTGDRALPYMGPILLEESTLLTFMAFDGDRWSKPVSELYERHVAVPTPDLVARGLYAADDNVVFTARRGEPGRMEKTIRIQSVGLQSVQIEKIYITFNPRSWSFWEEGVFLLETPVVTPRPLAPGESIDLTVSYAPTETIRTAVLVIESNDQRHEEGMVLIDLMGRIFDW